MRFRTQQHRYATIITFLLSTNDRCSGIALNLLPGSRRLYSTQIAMKSGDFDNGEEEYDRLPKGSQASELQAILREDDIWIQQQIADTYIEFQLVNYFTMFAIRKLHKSENGYRIN